MRQTRIPALLAGCSYIAALAANVLTCRISREPGQDTTRHGLIGTLVPGACWKIPPVMSPFE
jgi:hypothetical protein